ncbi:MAG: hypothetical protein CYPHOPRED_004060 [Cyphobasidiales sp. Tagirdzhanova-0007]|nr:MAG: hypothetical protein CYPHOPRED_004060 [Cyphobasidiales sp. Tagirdzhanova-0007]
MVLESSVSKHMLADASSKKSKKSKGKQREQEERTAVVQEQGATTSATPLKSTNGEGTSRHTSFKAVNDPQGSSSDFTIIRSVMRIPLAPIFTEDPLEGIRQCLDSWVMRYLPSLDAVLLTVSWPPEFLDENASLAESSAFALVRIRWEGIGFRPQIGRNSRKLSLATPSILSLLLHNLFNASITAEHIPKDMYEWDSDATLPYSLAPLYLKRTSVHAARPPTGEEEAESNRPQDIDEDGAAEAAEPYIEPERGCWVHKVSREPLGGKDGQISFTVISLTVANSMISVQGSLLANPFSAFATNGKIGQESADGPDSSTTLKPKSKRKRHK